MQPKPTLLKRPLTVALASFGLFAAVHSAHAATYTVSNTNDSGSGSLRDAIAQANANPGADTIVFSGVSGTITLTSGELTITDSVTITGPGAGSLAISGNNASRVFTLPNVAGSSTTISDLSIVNGAATNGAGMLIGSGTNTLSRVRFANNTASGKGGAIHADGFEMSLSVSDCTFSGNSATVMGGAIYIEDTDTDPARSVVSIARSVFTGNASGRGGAIYLYDPDGNVTIDQSVFSNNSATISGGAIQLYSFDGNPTFTISNSVFAGNTAPVGGAIFLDEIDTPMLVVNSTFTGNSATGGVGGAIALNLTQGAASLTIRETTIVGNSATSNGGGISSTGASVVPFTLVNTVLAGNSAPASPDAGGTHNLSATNSLIQSTTLSVTNNGGVLQNTAANIGTLAANNGPSVGAPGFTAVLQTMLPNPGSPLIDAGTATGVQTTDQRGVGFPRVVGSAPDIGAAELEEFQITEVIAPVGGGTLVCTPDPVRRGSSTTCVATPSAGYSFVSQTGDCSSTTASCTISNVTSAKTVTANFALNSYPVTEVIAPVGGGTLVCMPDPVPHGSSTTCAATPSVGYSFVSQTGDCSSTTASCTISNVTSAKTVTANFALNSYPVTEVIAPVGGGTLVCTPDPVPHGSSTTCAATPSVGYSFVSQTGDCASTTASCTISNVTSARTVTANFAQNAYPITVNVGPIVGGSVLCTPNPVAHGQTATCTATASFGYTFVGFSGDCSGSTCTLSNVTGSRTVNATFSAIPPAVVSVFSGLYAFIMVGIIGLAAGLRRRYK